MFPMSNALTKNSLFSTKYQNQYNYSIRVQLKWEFYKSNDLYNRSVTTCEKAFSNPKPSRIKQYQTPRK
jgi:hypothetical protein